MSSSPSRRRRAATVVGWLVFGVACGLVTGFLAGLARPRAHVQSTGPMGTGTTGSGSARFGPGTS